MGTIAAIKLVEVGLSLVGTPYVRDAGHGALSILPPALDCSGLTRTVFWIVGGQDLLNSNSEGQWAAAVGGKVVGALLPGDFAFFVGGPPDSPPGHVGIVITYDHKSGTGTYVSALNPNLGTRVEPFSTSDSQWFGATRPASVIPDTMTTVGDVVTQVATNFRLDPVLALADAWHESGLNPRAEGDDFGNGPTSFGLYQLHEGGELGNLTPAQAMNPTTNCMVALQHFAAVKILQPSLSGGALAATAQRPANAGAYAAAVDQLISEINAGQFPPGYIAARDAAAGVPPPFPPPAPQEETMNPVLTINPNNGGTIILDTAQGTFNGLSSPAVESYYENVCKVPRVETPSKAVFARFKQVGTI